MKPIDFPPLSVANSTLTSLDAGEALISGKIELYSAKPDAPDKHLTKQLEKKFEDEYYEETSPHLPTISPTSPYGGSPFSWEDSSNSRRVFVQLISTLNQAFPDYDFSSVRPQSFMRETSAEMVTNSVNLTLSPAALPPRVLADVWSSVDQAISVKDAEIFSFSDSDSGLDEGKIWSFYLFFVNRRMHRILFFWCTAQNKHIDHESLTQEYEEEDDDVPVRPSKNAGVHYSRIERGKNFGFHFRVPSDEKIEWETSFDFDPEDEFDDL